MTPALAKWQSEDEINSALRDLTREVRQLRATLAEARRTGVEVNASDAGRR